MLTEQLQTRIEQEAEANTLHFKDVNDYDAGRIGGYKEGYEAAGVHYGALWQTAEQWKKEASLLLNPLLEWGQAQKDMPLGVSITAEILRRAKLWQAAEEKAARYEKALKEILEHIKTHRANEMGIALVISEALTPKTSEDE